MSEIPQHCDNVDDELPRIKLALDAVFSPLPVTNQQDASTHWWEQRQLADRYLTSFQRSTVAWMVCDRLLQDNAPTSSPQEAMQKQQRRFFAAQTLNTKCRSDAHQLPQASLPSLRDSLLNHLNTYSQAGDFALTNRLAMCTSALAVQMAWVTIVTDLLSSTVSQPQRRTVVLQILKVLPEECASDRLILVDENVRYHMRDHLVSSSSAVFQFLQTWDGPAEAAYEVLLAWIRYVPVQPYVLMESPLLEATFHALLNTELMELAADVIIETYRMYPSHHPSNQGLVQKMIPLSSNLPFKEALQSGDEDVLRTYCRIITEMGESYMSLILSSQHVEASQLVDWVLRCSSIADIEIASITLHFWYRMVLDLESVEPYDYRQDLVDRYTPYLLQLLDTCSTNLMRYPHDLSDIAEDRLDDINRDRFYVSETIEDCCRLLGGQVVLHRFGTLLKAECSRAGQNIHTEWQAIESSLACIQAINRFVPSDEAEFLPFCFGLIAQLPADVPALRFTASKLIGKYATWLAAHPLLLQPLLPYLAHSLSIPQCAPAAAIAIKELCECSNQQMSMGEPVLELYTQITASPGLLDLKDELEVLEGVCRAVSRQVHDTGEDGSVLLQRIVLPIGTRLTMNMANQNCNPKKHIMPELDRLTVVARFLTLPQRNSMNHPMVDLLQSCWTLLDAASKGFPHDTALAEKICRLYKHALRACGAVAFTPMLEPLMEQLIISYERSHQAPFLYAASICVSEYGNDPNYSAKLFHMINSMAVVSFSFLRNFDDLTHQPDVVEELFYLMGRMISHCPEPLVLSPLLHSLFQCAIVGMKLDHREANKGTLNFLENSVSYGLSLRERKMVDCQQALERVLVSEGQAIVSNLAGSLMGDLPAYTVDKGHGSIAGIIWKMNLLSPNMVAQWMSVAMSNAPERPRIDFMSALDSGLPRDDFNLTVRAFMSACERERRLRGGQQ